jgi:hypothetical protein
VEAESDYGSDRELIRQLVMVLGLPPVPRELQQRLEPGENVTEGLEDGSLGLALVLR